MAKCSYCGSTIIMGGVRDGGSRFCDQNCAHRSAVAVLANRVDPSKLAQQVSAIHQGPCPKCSGPGPVDVSTAYQVWSVLILTRWSHSSEISCRSCGRKRQAFGALFSLIAGWWGFPWGLILTPVQIGRNVAGMFRNFDPYRPSPALESAVKLTIGSRLLAQQRSAG